MTKEEIWEQAYEEGFQDGMFSGKEREEDAWLEGQLDLVNDDDWAFVGKPDRTPDEMTADELEGFKAWVNGTSGDD